MPPVDDQAALDAVIHRAQATMRRSLAQLRRHHPEPDALDDVLMRAGIGLADVIGEALGEIQHIDRRYSQWFRAQWSDLWGTAFDWFEIANIVAMELNRMALGQWRPDVVLKPRYEALVELHARSIVVTSEIIALLREGYPEGAKSRWRTLHEIEITSRLVSRSQNIAQRFMDSRFLALEQELQSPGSDTSGLTPSEVIAITSEVQGLATEAVRRHGPELKLQNGWAWPLFKQKRITITDLEKKAGISRRRPAYGRASESVHSSRLANLQALLAGRSGDLYVGPRLTGLAMPAMQALWSSSEMTGLLLREVHRSTKDDEALVWDDCHGQLCIEADTELRRAARGLAPRDRADHNVANLPPRHFERFIREAANPRRARGSN